MPPNPFSRRKCNQRHALLLIGAQYRFQFAEWRTFQLCCAALFGRALSPGGRGLDSPIAVLAQSRFEKAGLLIRNAIAPGILLRRAIEQNLLQFFHRAGVNDRHLSVLQPRVALPGEYQSLDFGRRERLACRSTQKPLPDQTIAHPTT